MATTLSVDPRFQIPDSLPTSDPSHPVNLIQSIYEVQNQAAADSAYDIPTPERFRQGKKEAFRSPFQGNADYVLALGVLVLLALIWVYVRDTTRTLYLFVLLLAFSGMFVIHKKAYI